MSIPVFRPTLRRRDFNSVLGCLVSDRIGSGPLAHELAGELARYLGVAGGACLTTFQAAVHCALDTFELQPGASVILSALAPAEYLPLLAGRGLQAVVVDVDPATGLLRFADAERCLASGAKAMVLHYPLGFVPETEDLFALGLPVLEDISQALGGACGGPAGAEGSQARCGGLGQASVLSLAPEGVITAGTGAAVFVRERRALKALRDAVDRQPRDGLLPDLNAALGLAQVRELEAFLKSRRAVAEVLAQAVARSRHGRLGAERESLDVPYGFPVLVKEGVKQVRQFAMKKGVETRSAFSDAVIAFGRVADEPAAAGPVEKAEGGGEPGATGLAAREFLAEVAAPNAKDLLGRCTLFPLYPTLTKRDVQLIAKVLSALP